MISYTDLTGQRFGHLTVLEYAGKVGGYNAWKCRCDCGNVVTILLIPIMLRAAPARRPSRLRAIS